MPALRLRHSGDTPSRMGSTTAGTGRLLTPFSGAGANFPCCAVCVEVGHAIQFEVRGRGALATSSWSIEISRQSTLPTNHLASSCSCNHYRIWSQYQPSWPPRYRGGPDGWGCGHTVIQQCFLSSALPRERYPPGRHWRAGPYLYGSNSSSE